MSQLLMTEQKTARLRLILNHLDAALDIADNEDEPLLGAKIHDCLLTTRNMIRAIEGDNDID